MPVLLVAEHTNAALGSATAKALTAAKLIDAEVHVLVAGHNCGPAAAQAASGDESLGFELVSETGSGFMSKGEDCGSKVYILKPPFPWTD